MTDKLFELCKKASEIILSFPKTTRVRIISHYDADGITAASIMCKALYREGYDFHATLMRNPFDKGLERVSKEDNELIIFTDMGSGQINTIEKMNCKCIIVDHHQFRKEKTTENVFQINANLCDINGNYEACGATLALSLAKALNSKNKDLVGLALVGATGDKQYIGGFRGYNKNIIDEALKEGLIKENVEIKLNGENLSDALYYSIDPYYSGISGNKKAISDLLDKLGLSKDIKFEDLNKEEIKKLQSYLMLVLIQKNLEKNILDTIIRPRYYSETIGYEFDRFADLIDSCGKGGNRSLGFSVAMGDKNAFNQALIHEKEYKEKILDELLRLEKEGFEGKKSIRYFYSNDSSLGGVIGGIAMNFLLDREKALLSLVKSDDELHVSCRGTQYLVGKGLDLGLAMKEASTQLGGIGGGHAIASGATIASDKEKEFLDIVDSIIVNQLKG